MTTLSPAQIYALARSVGLGPAAAATATGVALAESGGRTDAIGDVALENATWGPSVGIWQIRSLKAQSGTGGPRDATRLTDPTFNARAMHVISGGGQNFGAWTTYTSGKWKTALAKVSPTDLAGGELSSLPLGIGGEFSAAATGAGKVAAATATALKDLTSGGLLGLALKVVAGGAAAALVIVGAVHTVSDK